MTTLITAAKETRVGFGVFFLFLFFKECCFRLRVRVRLDTNPNPNPKQHSLKKIDPDPGFLSLVEYGISY